VTTADAGLLSVERHWMPTDADIDANIDADIDADSSAVQRCLLVGPDTACAAMEAQLRRDGRLCDESVVQRWDQDSNADGSMVTKAMEPYELCVVCDVLSACGVTGADATQVMPPGAAAMTRWLELLPEMCNRASRVVVVLPQQPTSDKDTWQAAFVMALAGAVRSAQTEYPRTALTLLWVDGGNGDEHGGADASDAASCALAVSAETATPPTGVGAWHELEVCYRNGAR